MKNQDETYGQSGMLRLLSKERRTVLMGFAILLICIYHLFYFTYNTYDGLPYRFRLVYNFFKDGYIGVDIFLFLSAFGLCYSYRDNTLPRFYYKRFLRIFPFYIGFAVLLTIFFLRDYDMRDQIKVWVYQFTGLYDLGVHRITITEWFTPALILLYAAFPIFYHVIGASMRHKWLLVAFIFVVSLFADVMSLYFEGALAGRISVIILGVMTFFILDKDKDDRALWPLYLICAAVTLVSPYRIAALSMLVPLFLLCLSKIEIKDNSVVRILSFVGAYSFEIYLAQQFATSHVLRRLGPDMNPWLNVGICILITPPLAILFHYTGKGLVWLLKRGRALGAQ